MIYEIKKHRLCERKAICIFCGKNVSWSDYAYMCKKDGKIYYKIPKVLRILLPKIVILYFIKTIRFRLKAKNKLK